MSLVFEWPLAFGANMDRTSFLNLHTDLSRLRLLKKVHIHYEYEEGYFFRFDKKHFCSFLFVYFFAFNDLIQPMILVDDVK